MTFAEADRRYADLKQQFAAGALTVDQFDDQLHELMVQDSLGRWWAKSRESGEWHYYDPVTDAWVQALPPADKPAPPPPSQPAEPPPKQQKQSKQDKEIAKAKAASSQPARPQAAEPKTTAHASSPAPTQPTAGQEVLPKWAAVAPGSEPVASPGPARLEPLPATSANPLAEQPDTPIPAPGSSSRLRDFGPVPELSGGLKLVLYMVSLLVPIAGILLFLVYRNKPAQADRAAARTFLILGVLSLVFTCLCSGSFWLLEGVMFGTKPV